MRNYVTLARTITAVLLIAGVSALTLTTVRSAAPVDAPIWPFLIFGLSWMILAVAVVVHDHDSQSNRFGVLVALFLFAVCLSAVAGGDAGWDIARDHMFGWFMGGMAGALVVVGAVIGFLVPSLDELNDLRFHGLTRI